MSKKKKKNKKKNNSLNKVQQNTNVKTVKEEVKAGNDDVVVREDAGDVVALKPDVVDEDKKEVETEKTVVVEESFEKVESSEEEKDESREEKSINEESDSTLGASKTDDSINKDEDVKTINFDVTSEVNNTEKSKKKMYINFETRVGVSIVLILFLFGSACFLILQALNFGKDEVVTYSEKSDVTYNVCLNEADYYADNCLNPGMNYVSLITNNIKVNYNYDVNFSTDIEYDLAYHIVAVTKIYDNYDSTKVLYENEDLMVEKTPVRGNNKLISIDKEVLVPFKTYNDFVVSYKTKYMINSKATLEVMLYLDEPTETRVVSSIVVPLGRQTFGIETKNTNNLDKEVVLDNDTWNDYNMACAVIGTLLIIIALLILFRLTTLVLKVTSKRNLYQVKLTQILRDYDKYIVIARDGYIPVSDKVIIKVLNFNELLDARNMLNKPIIYSKVNPVKSEFIVEDEEKIYKYVMKESDFSK